MAISTFCRHCGEHYNIRNGRSEAPVGSRVSGIAGIKETPTSTIKPAKEFLREAEGINHEEDPDEASPIVEPQETPKAAPKINPIAAAANLPESDNPATGEATLGAVAEEGSTKTGIIGRLFDGASKVTPEPAVDPSRMPNNYQPLGKKGDSVEKRDIRCFECNHLQQVSIAAASTQCGRCSVYISLSNKVIDTPHSQNIRTRGDVTITKKGALIGCDIACENLTVLGKISGSVDCSGNATFKNSGKVLGSMHCKHLFIDKKCELVFPQGIIAQSADIHGTVHGNIICSGTIKIFKTGSVEGDARAKAVVLKDGGMLSGQMSIQHDIEIELPHKKGYLEVTEYEPPTGDV